MDLQDSVNEVIQRLTFLVDNKKVRQDYVDSVTWCVATLHRLQTNLQQMSAFTSYMRLQQKLRLAEQLENL